ncbi:MAG: aromatic amino acid hydroxylase [Bacteroidales bacterium]|nr:aromatic amino acid hydroxylase [Bacteroidales bacterium]
MESNEVLDSLPRHLLSLVIEQPYNDYTAQDHAVWRYVMRQNVRYLPHVAHSSYLDGLSRTGISIDYIPHMYGMNRILKEIGWAAVAVDGFIPPAAFMEFQAYNVLVIAADIRPVDQVSYTPAPDIIHEAAGHAPIIADTQYASYLREFGKTGAKAFASRYDDQIYEAIRHLSILKADPYSSSDNIEQAEKELEILSQASSGPSEMALLRNLHWWTVEYGLIGEMNNPKIYGAGLLSSIGESYSCLQDNVKKIPYSIEAKDVNFDITTRQPQLFVTPDFDELNKVLETYASTMSARKGGLAGVRKAINSGNLSTVNYTSGIQISGILEKVIEFDNQPAYLSFLGPTMLSYADKMISGQGKEYHAQGFGSPVGFLKGVATPLEFISDTEFERMGISEGKRCRLDFESGVSVEGTLRSKLVQKGKTILLTFVECTVRYEDQVLFEPGWGPYDMTVGAGIANCYPGVADPGSYNFEFPVPTEKTHKLIHTPEAKSLHQHYHTIQQLREQGGDINQVQSIFEELVDQYPKDWLLPLEIHELIENVEDKKQLCEEILRHLKRNAIEDKSLLKLIQDGLAVNMSSQKEHDRNQNEVMVQI